MLERRDGVVPFGDMLTQCNATHKSVPVILSSVSAENYNDIFEQKSIITAFKEAGFATLYISNQVPNRSLIDYFSAEADRRVDISPREGQLYTDNRPDGDMLPILRQAVASTDSSLFVVLHMYGSHMDYTKRYPKDFAFFTPDDASAVNRETKDKVRNAYDNSIRYTDYVLDQVISVLDSTDAVTAPFLLLRSWRGPDGRRPEPLFARLSHTDLLSASCGQLRMVFRPLPRAVPRKVPGCAENCGKPATSASVFHNLADIASLRSPYVDSTQAFTSAGFVPVLRRMYLNDYNEAVEFYNSGLEPEDFEMLDKHRIEYDRNHVRTIRY